MLFEEQRSRLHGDAWLKRGEDLNAAEAYARFRTGKLREAVTALDRGRALRLSAALDGRVVAARLRIDQQDGLADRYERTIKRLRWETELQASGALGTAPLRSERDRHGG